MYQKRDLWKKVCIFCKKEEAFIPPLAEVGGFCLDLDNPTRIASDNRLCLTYAPAPLFLKRSAKICDLRMFFKIR